MISINTSLSIDLTGQLCSESIGFRQFSGFRRTGGLCKGSYPFQRRKILHRRVIRGGDKAGQGIKDMPESRSRKRCNDPQGRDHVCRDRIRLRQPPVSATSPQGRKGSSASPIRISGRSLPSRQRKTDLYIDIQKQRPVWGAVSMSENSLSFRLSLPLIRQSVLKSVGRLVYISIIFILKYRPYPEILISVLIYSRRNGLAYDSESLVFALVYIF